MSNYKPGDTITLRVVEGGQHHIRVELDGQQFDVFLPEAETASATDNEAVAAYGKEFGTNTV